MRHSQNIMKCFTALFIGIISLWSLLGLAAADAGAQLPPAADSVSGKPRIIERDFPTDRADSFLLQAAVPLTDPDLDIILACIVCPGEIDFDEDRHSDGMWEASGDGAAQPHSGPFAGHRELPPGITGLPPGDECASSGFAGTLYENGINCRLVKVDGYPRAYIVYVPPRVQDPAPAVFMFHGSSGDGAQFYQISGWKEKADEQGFVAVFPTGVKYCNVLDRPLDSCKWTTKWHSYQLIEDEKFNFEIRPSGYPASAPYPADDVGFANAMLDDLLAPANGLNIAAHQVFVSGFSNGGSMAARLAIEISERLAAAAYVAGGIIEVNDPANLPPAAVDHIPVFAAFGTADDGIMAQIGWDPRAGKLPLDQELLFAVEGFAEVYLTPHLNAFDHTYNPDTFVPYFSNQGSHATLVRWHTPQVGGAGHLFQLGVLEGLQHHWPRGCEHIDKNPNCFNAVDVFWPFFEEAANNFDGGSGSGAKPMK
ncbi:MAG: hypothetical protein R3293_24430 [Candidatus Promineifilaceae bacterium]|nr:hypothetical protein [Candidatus Promineifilaceae bacterium]